MAVPTGVTLLPDVRDLALRAAPVEPSTIAGGSLSPFVKKIALTNNVIEGPYLSISQDPSAYGEEPVPALTFRNNLLRDGTCSLRQ